MCLLVHASPCRGATAAGSTIVNVAHAGFIQDGPSRETSNSSSLRIDEVLDIDLHTDIATAVTTAAVTAIPFTIRNPGNGNEPYLLHGGVTGTGVNFLGFAADSNGNGTFEPDVDAVIANDMATALIASGATLALLALIRADAGATTGTLTIAAKAGTGSGLPKTIFPGAGDDGTDAIVGTTTAAATVTLPATAANISLTKSQSVLAPDGSSRPVIGAIVTYSIVAIFGGPGVAAAARIVDPIPAGTDYVASSLRLDGIALTDAADGDAGVTDTGSVTFALGDIPTAATHRVSFQVKIR